MEIALGCVVLITAGLVWLLDRQGARHHEEQESHRLQLAELLQRVQAPEAAIAQHAVQHMPAVQDSFPMTDAEIAEQEERQAAISRIEQMENGGIEALR